MGIRDWIERMDKAAQEREKEREEARNKYYSDMRIKAEKAKEELKRIKEMEKDRVVIEKVRAWNEKENRADILDFAPGLDKNFNNAFSLPGNGRKRK